MHIQFSGKNNKKKDLNSLSLDWKPDKLRILEKYNLKIKFEFRRISYQFSYFHVWNRALQA